MPAFRNASFLQANSPFTILSKKTRPYGDKFGAVENLSDGPARTIEIKERKPQCEDVILNQLPRLILHLA